MADFRIKHKTTLYPEEFTGDEEFLLDDGSKYYSTKAGTASTKDIGTADGEVPTNADIASKQYDFDNMPQVDGNPIVESGSNSDGEWTRWADGTQIVKADRIEFTGLSGTSHGQDFPYPKEFTSGTTAIITLERASAQWDDGDDRQTFATSSPTSDTAKIYLFRDNKDDFGGTSGAGSYIAYGRWF